MRGHEVGAFARAIGCERSCIAVFDLLRQRLDRDALDGVDVVLLGGSGDYSATGSERWLMNALDSLKMLCDLEMPVFASCWGFQAFARAMGGRVERDESRSEVGSFPVHLTEEAKSDPIFGRLPQTFYAHMGHMDHVTQLPAGATRLAYSERSENQAYTFAGLPIYATQFHPELERADLLCRLQQYPDYVRGVTGMSFEAFQQQLRDTPECSTLLRTFMAYLQR